jgi:hypothetical protein
VCVNIWNWFFGLTRIQKWLLYGLARQFFPTFPKSCTGWPDELIKMPKFCQYHFFQKILHTKLFFCEKSRTKFWVNSVIFIKSPICNLVTLIVQFQSHRNSSSVHVLEWISASGSFFCKPTTLTMPFLSRSKKCHKMHLNTAHMYECNNRQRTNRLKVLAERHCRTAEQGDQIGRFFAYWAVDYFEQCF